VSTASELSNTVAWINSTRKGGGSLTVGTCRNLRHTTRCPMQTAQNGVGSQTTADDAQSDTKRSTQQHWRTECVKTTTKITVTNSCLCQVQFDISSPPIYTQQALQDDTALGCSLDLEPHVYSACITRISSVWVCVFVHVFHFKNYITISIILTLSYQAVTVRTTCFYIQKLCILATAYLRTSHLRTFVSQNKDLLFP
jgi:hypothetical protein